MKQVIYMDGSPIKHPGVKGRELPLKVCDLFTPLDAEHLFLSAGKVETFASNVYRIQSFTEAYEELKEMQKNLNASKSVQSPADQYRTERKIRSFFIEADVFFSHWRRFLGVVRKRSGVDIFYDMEQKYKNDVTYQLLRIIRNYIMHAGDIIHGAHNGMFDDNFQLWADADVIRNDIREKKDKAILAKIDKRIDLLKLADDAAPIVKEIHEFFMKSVAEKDKWFNLKAECEYLLSMRNKIVLFKPTDWFVVSYTGPENVDVGLPYIGGVTGFGIDYHRLDWGMYHVLGEWIEKNENTDKR